MPINVKGITDASGALRGAVIPSEKYVYVVGAKGTGSTATPRKVFDVFGIADAESKWGADAKAVTLVRILVANGVANIRGMMVEDVVAPATKSSVYDACFGELLKENTRSVVIVDEIDPTVHSKLRDHMDLAEAEEIFRYGVVGYDTTDNTTITTQASAINHKRMFVPGPTVLDTDGNILSGICAAAGLASLLVTETDDPALPMNGVQINGFSGTDRVLLGAEKTALINGGVTPLITVGGKVSVYRLVTTYTMDGNGDPDITWQEGTTVFISDDVLSACINRIKGNYKRTKNVARILKAMRTDIIDVLQVKNNLEIIENFDANTVSVVKDPNDLYGALIDYEYDVVTPLYTVTIRQHMKL